MTINLHTIWYITRFLKPLDVSIEDLYNFFMQKEFQPIKFTAPQQEKRILLHTCCAPCACIIIESFIYSGFDFTVFFYNPNIHPKHEYELRKKYIKQFCEMKNVPFIDPGYDPQKWFKRIRGLENEPERGKRCTECFDIRLELAAVYAHESNFKVFTSSCGIARWKDMDQVNSCGLNAAAKYPGLTYWTQNCREQGGSQGMYTVSKKEGFYKQEYCGCLYSLMANNRRRREKGLGPIVIGSKFYGDKHSPHSIENQPSPSKITV